MATVNTLTKYQPNMDLGNEPKWHSFLVDWQDDLNEADSAAHKIDLIDLPVGSMLLDAKIGCVLQWAGATTGKATLILKTATTVIHAGTADNMKVTGVTDVLEVGNVNAWPIPTTADTLQAKLVLTGDGMSTGPKALISVLLCRTGRPGA